MDRALVDLLPDYLCGQRWFSGVGRRPRDVGVVRMETLQKGVPGLVWVLADADGARYQVLVGLRRHQDNLDFLQGSDHAVLGSVRTDEGEMLAYDALLDHELSMVLLELVTDGAEKAELVRPIGGEQSNSSMVYDERLVLKLFRRVHEGRNPDIEVVSALARVGFEHVAEPVAVWREDDYDLAVVQRFLAGATDGWALALTSLRDLYGSGSSEPAACGGDFAGEARRLGVVTAEMHLALAEAFGTAPADVTGWAAGMRRQLDRVAPGEHWSEEAAAVFAGLAHHPSPGPAIRVHGDYHLGQAVRTDSGWYVLDFEGEPERPLEERRQLSSPLKDVAGMLRSLQYAAQVALQERTEEERAALSDMAVLWERHNRTAFLNGYTTVPSIETLLPDDRRTVDTALAAWELDKAVYELAYEQAHRPEWAHIPLSAIARLLGSGGR